MKTGGHSNSLSENWKEGMKDLFATKKIPRKFLPLARIERYPQQKPFKNRDGFLLFLSMFIEGKNR